MNKNSDRKQELRKLATLTATNKKIEEKLKNATLKLVQSIDGLVNAEYLRKGMRDIESVRGFFAGLSPEKANEVALGNQAGANGEFLPPINVLINQEGKKANVNIIDGRHRSVAAREAGANSIKAIVDYYIEYPDGSYEQFDSFSMNLPLGEKLYEFVQYGPEEFGLEKIKQ